MLRYFLTFFLILVSCNAEASWVKVGENDRAIAYANNSSEKMGDSIIVWVLYDYKEPQVSPRSGKQYMSEKAQYEIVCNAKKYRNIFFTWHSKNMGTGLVVYTGRKVRPWEPTSAPYSYGEAFDHFYCSKQ